MNQRRRSILVAENNRSLAHSIRLHLERAGFSVYVAHDGEQAAILAARQRFDLIVCDLDLPVMNGAEFCRHVREDLRLTEMPIAVCCLESQQADADRLVFSRNVARVFLKPVDPALINEFARETVGQLVSTH